MTYASETCVLKETIIQKLLVFERKIWRWIFGPTKENQIWRVKTSEELDTLKHKNIINYIKAQRLSWFSHVQRIQDTRTIKKIFNWKPLTKRLQGRPKYRWEDNIKHLPNEDKKLDSLRPGSREMERGRWEGQKLSTRKFSAWKKKKIICTKCKTWTHNMEVTFVQLCVSSLKPHCGTL